MNPISSILRQATKNPNEPFRILTANCHESFQTEQAKSNAIFYAIMHDQHKKWMTKYRPLPPNYIETDTIPEGVDFDLVLSHTKFGQFQTLAPLAKQYHLPLISLEHTLPVPFWNQEMRNNCRNMRGDLNVFISDFSIREWGFSDTDPTVRVVKHGIDTERFKPDKSKEKEGVVFSCVNDWVNRDIFCGYKIWEDIITMGEHLPFRVMGDTPGLSLPAKSTDELIDAYQTSRVFLNTSTVSPIPTVLLEAMSSGVACVSTATCMIPEVIEHGVNGLMSNDPQKLREYCELLLKDNEYVEFLGNNARKTIVEKFNANRFAQDWNDLFLEASQVIFRE